MNNTFRDCPGCRCRREFIQIHPDPGRCPDVSTGICPEWVCTDCGAALLIDLAPAAAAPAGSLGSLERVA
ncbi:MAG TPA: hypothetical protein VFQ44_24210 [Streptosporangiaceae bacterium]|nr:hypothetical protein [Streptosporangiaceae bacterium]